jgi:hypothetical protein
VFLMVHLFVIRVVIYPYVWAKISVDGLLDLNR